jgi:hypothetical protein
MRHIHLRKSLLGTCSPQRQLFISRTTTSQSMKRRGQDTRKHPHKHPQLSALMPVVALLLAATLAKLGAATQFFHLGH